MVTASAAHTAMPPTKRPIRAVPRSRIVARSDWYCSYSLAVMFSTLALAATASAADTVSMVREDQLDLFELIRHDNSLAVYELSATITFAVGHGTTLTQGRYA